MEAAAHPIGSVFILVPGCVDTTVGASSKLNHETLFLFFRAYIVHTPHHTDTYTHTRLPGSNVCSNANRAWVRNPVARAHQPTLCVSRLSSNVPQHDQKGPSIGELDEESNRGHEHGKAIDGWQGSTGLFIDAEVEDNQEDQHERQATHLETPNT